MKTHPHLNFVISKIQDLQTAVLHNDSNSVLNVPSNVVKTLHVDETGCIWFAIFRPMQSIAEFESRFPVALHYYQKGRSFYLNIQGMARLVIDPEEINSLPSAVSSAIDQGKVLICVKITTANYHQLRALPAKNPISHFKDYLKSLFESENYYINFEQSNYVA